MASAKTISIQELFTGNYSFVVKPYQRGYRWEQKQIEYLLKDLSSIERGEEYCLQPIIVVQTDNGNEYELVDGQQRLTTLWILKELYASTHSTFNDPNAKSNFKLKYENKYPLQSIMTQLHTKLDDEKLIEKIATDNSTENDFAYRNIANNLTINCNGEEYSFKKGEHPDIDAFIENICIISKYQASVANLGVQNINYFLENIFKPQDGFRRSDSIKVIWYELEKDKKDENPITVFTNVNANKIKLTNSELIKARLLYEINENIGSNPHSLTRSKLSLEWENIERELNDDRFWLFIHGKGGKYATRIDFLFEVYLSVDKKQEFWAYDEIDKRISEGHKVEDIWKPLSKVFYTLQDWYNDESNEIYHLLGLLVAIKERNIASIIRDYYKEVMPIVSNEESVGLSKDEFIKKLKTDIKASIYPEDNGMFLKANVIKWLNQLDYDKDKEIIKNVLLTYNVASIINSKNRYERFPFDLYNSDNYDIEHINPKSNYQREQNIEVKEMNTKHIGNLVLLDAKTNRSDEYKTQSYQNKRNIIIHILRQGDTSEESNKVKYIPIGTRWVFLEAFENLKESIPSKDWSKHEEYIEDIANNITYLLGEDLTNTNDCEDLRNE